jgi:hypothetical protein
MTGPEATVKVAKVIEVVTDFEQLLSDEDTLVVDGDINTFILRLKMALGVLQPGEVGDKRTLYASEITNELCISSRGLARDSLLLIEELLGK